MCVRAAPHIGAPPLAIARQSIEPGKTMVTAAVMDGSGRGAAKKTRVHSNRNPVRTARDARLARSRRHQ
jgi:hypothetical protein